MSFFKPSGSLLHETWLIFQLSLPIGLSIVSEWIPVYAGNAVLGHLPNAQLILSGAGLARTFNNVTGASLAWAFTQGLFTLIPQAIGQNRKDLLGLYLQRAGLVCFVLVLPLSVLQLFGASFLVWIGAAPKELEHIIYDCCKWGIGNIFALNLVSLIQKVAQSFGYQFALLFISLTCAVVSYPMAIFIIKSEYLNLGYIGCPITVFVLNAINALCIIVLLLYKGHYSLFIPHSWTEVVQWHHIYDYIMLCIPTLFTSSLEWWIMEITTVLAGYVTNPEIALSSNIIIGNIQIFVTLLALGNATAASIRVGKYVGARMIDKAKQTHHAALIVAILYSLIMVTTMSSCVDELPLIFTNKYQIQMVDAAISGLYAVILGVPFMNILQTAGGVYRAINKQKYSAIFISGSYYLVGFTLTLILLFVYDSKNNLIYGIVSIWFGWCVANICGSILLETFYKCCIDWNVILEDANERIDANTTLIKTSKGTDYGSTK